MKHFLWLAPAAVITFVGAAMWNGRQPAATVCVPPPNPNVAFPVAAQSGTPRAPEIIEPILVLPETEVAPPPEPTLVADLNVVVGRGDDFTVMKKNEMRPEAGRGERPWMPYAREDRDLSDQRRLEWAKLAVRDADDVRRTGDFEETAEPPLLEKR